MSDSSSILPLLEVRPEWLSQCRQHIERNPQLRGSLSTEQVVFSIYCHTDIISSCSEKQIIPENIKRLHKDYLFSSAPVILQIDKIENISDRFASAKDEPEGIKPIGRYNKLTLSDGHRQCIAMDFHGLLQSYQQRSFSVQLGGKVALKHIFVRRGALLLDGDCVCLLGGNVLHDGQSQIQRELLGLPTLVPIVDKEDLSKDGKSVNNTLDISSSTSTSNQQSMPSNGSTSSDAISAVNSSGGSGGHTSLNVATPSSRNFNIHSSSNLNIHRKDTREDVSQIIVIQPSSSYTQSRINASVPSSGSATNASAVGIQSTSISTPEVIDLSSYHEQMSMDIDINIDGIEAEMYSNKMLPSNTVVPTAAIPQIPTEPFTSPSSMLYDTMMDVIINEPERPTNQTPLTTERNVSPNSRILSTFSINSVQSTTPAISMQPLNALFSHSVPSSSASRYAHVRGFASRVYRCKLHSGPNVQLTRAFLRSYLAESQFHILSSQSLPVATSQLTLEVIIDFHDGMRSMPAILHPHVSCRFLATQLLSDGKESLENNEPSSINDSEVVTAEDIVACFQHFQGIFLVTPYPTFFADVDESRNDTSVPMLNFRNGFSDTLRIAGDRFLRKFQHQQQQLQQSSQGLVPSAYGSQSQPPANSVSTTSTSGNSSRNSSATPNSNPSNTEIASSPAAALILDFSVPLSLGAQTEPVSLTHSARKRRLRQHKQQHQALLRLHEGNMPTTTYVTPIEALIRDKMRAFR